MKELILGEIITLNKRLYRVEDSAFSNGTKQGRRAILKLLSKEEMEKIIFNNVFLNNLEILK